MCVCLPVPCMCLRVMQCVCTVVCNVNAHRDLHFVEVFRDVVKLPGRKAVVDVLVVMLFISEQANGLLLGCGCRTHIGVGVSVGESE